MDLDALSAHTPTEESDRWHSLVEHLRSVAQLAEEFGSKFGLGPVCSVLGLVHDAGKADPRFQTYLRQSHEGASAKSVPHAWPSAKALDRRLGGFALAVAGHHAGLPDADAWRTKAEIDPQTRDHAQKVVQRLVPSEPPKVPERLQRDALAAEMAVRMAFSALVDADRLDTERHCSPSSSELRGAYPSVSWYAERIREFWASFQAPDTPVNRIRAEILACCREAAASALGAFRLTVPTGGGKTLAGLTFSLEHAQRHGLDRVIAVAPYTSILDQTAQVYGSIFGEDRLLEHYSASPQDAEDEDQSQAAVRKRLGAENWDCPLVLTTTVQLFESLFSNRPGQCRKLHNVARSVILIDEVQTLPSRLLGPILDGLRELVENYGCTVVFCTATQPDYSQVDSRLVQSAREIVPQYEDHFERLRRVEYQIIQDELSTEELAGRALENHSSLIVVNRRKDAIRVLDALRAAEPSGVLLAHLSTLMCPAHRREVLRNVRRALQAGERVCLVSTQVVEAGVDLDFPVVYRDLGPLDRIIQVAGRCNREGRLDKGVCWVFRLQEGGTPKGDYALATQITENLLLRRGLSPDDPQTMLAFWREWYGHTETGSLEKEHDRAEIQKLRSELKFESVARNFRMIDQDTESVLIVERTPDGLLDAWRFLPPRKWFRRIAPFSVDVFRHEMRKLQDSGHVLRHDSGVWLYVGPYDELTGVHPELPDVADLVCM
ncbi:MAG TPA: CRISPR-associated helicase/endonuclease Cas3 [Armatimonadetes bacterium]|nr:CRISPR-associated helicase/endonuclease Cas3 [Armatimonadota bacterium]